MTMTKMRKEYERPVLVEIGSLVEITENGTPIFKALLVIVAVAGPIVMLILTQTRAFVLNALTWVIHDAGLKIRMANGII